MAMERVQVLMATYNGEKFLHQQIESILRQDGVDVALTVRDDGSSDKTCAILDEYKAQELLHWYSGNNLGPARSFMQLLKDAEPADFYAFSDQDDFWQPDKLSAAVQALKNHSEKPALYFCQTCLTDEYLQPLSRQIAVNPLLTFGESLVYEFVSGCTMVMNHALRKVLNDYRPTYLPMHDVWVYSVAQAIGAQIICDPKPHIFYRQHGHNTIGATQSRMQQWKERWRRFVAAEQSRSRRAAEIFEGYEPLMPAENIALLRSFLAGKTSFQERFRLLADKRLRCGDKHTQRLFTLNLLANNY